MGHYSRVVSSQDFAFDDAVNTIGTSEAMSKGSLQVDGKGGRWMVGVLQDLERCTEDQGAGRYCDIGDAKTPLLCGPVVHAASNALSLNLNTIASISRA